MSQWRYQPHPEGELVPYNTLIGGYPLSQEVLRQWGERNVQTKEGATDAQKMDRYFTAVIRWATRTFEGHANVDSYGDTGNILEYNFVFRTQTGSWSSGFRGIEPEYIPQYVERPKDRFLKSMAEKEFREFNVPLLYFIFIYT